MIYYPCGKCGAMLEGSPDLRGESEECPACGATNVVPAFTAPRRHTVQDAAILRWIGTVGMLAGGAMAFAGITLAAWMLACLGVIFMVAGDILRGRYGGAPTSNESSSQYCHRCKGLVSARRTRCDHLLHLSLTLASVGIWGMGWLVAALRKRWRCRICGRIIPATSMTAPRAADSAGPVPLIAISPSLAPASSVPASGRPASPGVPRWVAAVLLCGVSFGLGVLAMNVSGVMGRLPAMLGVSARPPAQTPQDNPADAPAPAGLADPVNPKTYAHD